MKAIYLTCLPKTCTIKHMEEILPIFKSHYSLGRSILTLDIPKDGDEESSDSIFDIAQEESLNEVFLVEDSITGFLEAYTNANELKRS